MKISIKEKTKKMKAVKEAQESSKELPEYLSLSNDKCEGSLESIPLIEQIPLPIVINLPLVCEFLAHTS